MKTVLVTGAGSGLGRAVALTLAAQGHIVYAGCQIRPQITDLKIDAEPLEDRLRPFRLDLTRRDDVAEAAAMAYNEEVDVLFNNAGIIEAGPLVEQAMAEVREVFETNVFGTLDLTQAIIARAFLPRRKGRVVFMSSVSGLVPVVWVGAYAASKHALEAIAATLRLELAACGIDVAVINPEMLDTGFDARAVEAHVHRYGHSPAFTGGERPVARLAQAHSAADVIEEICSVILGDDLAYRTVLPAEGRLEIHGRQAAVWAWSSTPTGPRLS